MDIYTKIGKGYLSILFHPHPAFPVEGEAITFPPLVGGIEGGG